MKKETENGIIKWCISTVIGVLISFNLDIVRIRSGSLTDGRQADDYYVLAIFGFICICYFLIDMIAKYSRRK